RREVERFRLVEAMPTHSWVDRLPAVDGALDGEVGQAAVDLVRRREQERGRSRQPPKLVDQPNRRLQVDLEVLDRVDQARRDRDLRREVEDAGRVGDGLAELEPVANVGDLDGEPFAVARAQPAQILLDARSREVVVDEHALAAGEQALGDVRADEAGASEHEPGAPPPAGARRRETTDCSDAAEALLFPETAQELRPAVGTTKAVVVVALVRVEA